jgi:hypothetical protein
VNRSRLALPVLVLALSACGRYGPPVRPVAAQAPPPGAEPAPADPSTTPIDQPYDPTRFENVEDELRDE